MKQFVHQVLSKASSFINGLRQIYRRGGIASYTIARVENGNRLTGKRILITGGGSGIGLAIARQCISEGACVLITGRNIDRMLKAMEEVGSDRLRVLQWDVSMTQHLADKLRQAVDMLSGEVDVLVNNAGVLSTTQFPEVTEEAWDRVYATNSRGLFFLTQALSKLWMQQRLRGKKILNISSQGGFVGATYPYRMTKWDVAGLTQGLAIKLAPHGIIVNGIAPGIIATGMQPGCVPEEGNIFCPHNPIGRFALAEEIAELATYLISDTSNFIVGQTIICDGGYSIR